MTRVSDLPEEEWHAHQDRVRRSLDAADETLARLDARAEERRRAEADERWQEHQRREEAEWERLPQPQQVPPRKWVEQIIDQREKVAIEAIGIAIGRAKKQRRDEMAALAEEIGKDVAALNARITKSEEATVSLLLELEGRIAALEERAVMKPPPKPKLVGTDDAA